MAFTGASALRAIANTVLTPAAQRSLGLPAPR